MGYSHYGIIFRDRQNRFVYRARAIGPDIRFQLKAIDADRMPLVKKVCDLDEPIRVKDIRGRNNFEPLNPNTRSVMVVPMNSHGRVNGVLTVESEAFDHFRERDLQMLSIVARSAALALENAELHKRTEELTIIDELTGAYNYRYFIRKLQEEKRRAIRYNLPLSLIMVDIDWFKKLNDTYGHEAGNEVLRSLAKTILQCVRDVDIFSRYGGEEFAVILPQTTRREALVIGERIRTQVEQAVIETTMASRLRITVSVGVSSFPENGRPEEELVSIADQALYRAKGEGRNHVCVI
jgi:diguanylate cyclase (GGDEF)-like protein